MTCVLRVRSRPRAKVCLGLTHISAQDDQRKRCQGLVKQREEQRGHEEPRGTRGAAGGHEEQEELWAGPYPRNTGCAGSLWSTLQREEIRPRLNQKYLPARATPRGSGFEWWDRDHRRTGSDSSSWARTRRVQTRPEGSGYGTGEALEHKLLFCVCPRASK